MKKIILLSVLVLLIGVSLVSAQAAGEEENITAPEPSCPPTPIPTSMWCPDGKTLCPQTTDESGCVVWDCDACEPIPEKKIICCKTWPVVPNPTYSYTWKAKNECPQLQDGLPPVGEGYEIVSNEYCEEPEAPVPEVPPTEKVRICAAKIKVKLDKEVYYYGASFKVVIEIFDSQGNPLPYYSFYLQTYTYHDGMWHTPEEHVTKGDGYFILEGTIEEGRQALGKTMLKAYTPDTKAYADCDSVEGTITAEVRKGEKEEVCGIGICVPEPEEPKEVVKIPEEKGLYYCMGCELDSKCYPIGYRKAGQYCSDNYEFIEQSEAGTCENHFECKSNVCISGECISESLLQKIINWFKRLFGIKEKEEGPKPEVDCSKLLIEENIGEYNYFQSGYGDTKESQAPLYSEDGEQIGTIKCCVAGYLEPDGAPKGTSALICPFDDRRDIENSLKWLSARGEITLGEYKEQKVYNAGNAIIWTHKEFALVVGTDPKADLPFPEKIADAYFEKYSNDLEGIEIPEEPTPEYRDPAKEFLKEAETIGEPVLIDFETLPDGTVLQNGDRLTGKEWESLGVTFEFPSEEYLQVFGPKYPFNPLDKLSLSPGLGPFEAGGDTHDDLNIIFSEPVKAAGIYLLDLGETDERESITFLDKDGNIIKEISPWPKSTFGNPAPGTFVGLVHEDGISKIQILENSGDGDDIAYDNLYFVR